MTADPLALTAASLAANWPYALIGQRWNLQHNGYFATTGEIVAIHPFGGEYSIPEQRLFFLRIEDGSLAVIPESAVTRYYREGKETP